MGTVDFITNESFHKGTVNLITTSTGHQEHIRNVIRNNFDVLVFLPNC